ncbi:hypothetical protein KJ865_02355, partial [Myxococcota bacterium]|nr:hypothetical protein [Myxococcota bacterium]
LSSNKWDHSGQPIVSEARGHLLVAPVGAASLPSAARPSPRNQYWWWKKRHNLLKQRLLNLKRVDVLFVGDSITHYWELAGSALWDQYFRGLFPFNFGVGGDQTQHILYRLINTDFGKLMPRVAVVLAGTNNAALHDGPRAITKGNQQIILTLKKKFPGIVVLLMGILPRGDRPTGTWRRAAGANKLMAKFHDGKEVFFIDWTTRFQKGHSVKPWLYKNDSLHLSNKGYALWGKLLKPLILAHLGKTSRVLAK